MIVDPQDGPHGVPGADVPDADFDFTTGDQPRAIWTEAEAVKIITVFQRPMDRLAGVGIPHIYLAIRSAC